MNKNIDFLETVSHYTRAQEPVQRSFSQSMSLVEEAMIRHYTDPAYDALNTALRSGNVLQGDLLEFRNVLYRALEKVPNYNGVSYRGLNEIQSISAEYWQVGKKIKEHAFGSSNISIRTADEYMYSKSGNVILEIQSKTGKQIKDASLLPLDEEVVFLPGVEFEVVKPATPMPNNPSVLVVTIREL